MFSISKIKASKQFRRPELNLVLDEKEDYEFIRKYSKNYIFLIQSSHLLI